jgi:hypothetical protein
LSVNGHVEKHFGVGHVEKVRAVFPSLKVDGRRR